MTLFSRAKAAAVTAVGLLAPVWMTAGTTEVIPTRPGAVALTVYNQDLALVHESHTVELPTGVSLVRMDGVTEGLEARSVQATFVSGNGRATATVLGQTYRGDLLSSSRLLEEWIGQPVTLVREPPEQGTQRIRATLLTTEGGLLFATDDALLLGHPGRIELPADAAETSGLTVRPALDWQLQARRAGDYQAEVRYLTGGLGWTADYVATLSEDESTLSLSTWVSIHNRSSRSFTGAELRLVAGKVNRVGGAPQTRMMRARMADTEAFSVSEPDQLFEYHLYTVDRPVNVPARSLHQLGLYETASVPVERQYLVRSNAAHALPGGGGDPQRPAVEVQLAFDNVKAAGLGLPLPAGVVRVYAAGNSGTQFLGEESLRHTPANERVSLTIGQAFDIVVERRQTDYLERSSRTRRAYEAGFRINVRNQKKNDVLVQVRETIPGDWTIMNKSHPVARLDVSTAAFEVPVSAGDEAVLTYRVKVD